MTPKKNEKSKNNKREFFHSAVSDKEKKKWMRAKGQGKRFTTVTQLIKFCVNGYLNGVLIEKIENVKSEKQLKLEKELKSINTEIKNIKEQNKELFEELKKERAEINETIRIADKQDLKESFHIVLKKGKTTVEELVKATRVQKTVVLSVLNEMEIDEKTIRLNPKDNTYELVKLDD